MYDANYAGIRLTYRRGVTRVLNAVEHGEVSEDDLHKLRNFCMVSLMLMAKVQEPTWRKAEQDAEIAGLIHEGNLTFKVEREDDGKE